MNADRVYKGEWFGGRLGGSLIRQTTGWLVLFQSPRERKQFPDSEWGDDRFQSLEAAKAHRAEISAVRGATKNEMRIATDHTGPYLEVKLQGDSIMKCDLDDSVLVESSTWTANKSGRVNTAYAQRSVAGTVDRFHRMLHPEWSTIDHLNRDGLDNRRSNLRDGLAGVNARNCHKRRDNRSGVTGVFYDSSHQAWIAEWWTNGTKHRKYFYGKGDGIKGRAIVFRLERAAEAENTNGVDISC